LIGSFLQAATASGVSPWPRSTKEVSTEVARRESCRVCLVASRVDLARSDPALSHQAGISRQSSGGFASWLNRTTQAANPAIHSRSALLRDTMTREWRVFGAIAFDFMGFEALGSVAGAPIPILTKIGV